MKRSLLYRLVQTYLEANGFQRGKTNDLWFHPELGVRPFKDAIDWWMRREEVSGIPFLGDCPEHGPTYLPEADHVRYNHADEAEAFS